MDQGHGTSRTVFLVDATYELFRAYFAMPSLKAPDGREVGAVRGLISSVLKLLREEDAEWIACATDSTVRSFRNDLFDGYKTGDGVEPALLKQFPLAEEALEALGVCVWRQTTFEADDALATAAAQLAARGDRVVICTPDKDLAQCVVGDQVVLRDRRRGKTYDAAGVKEKWGVEPRSIPDYLALVGDSADGIPGLKGWGKKGAAAVLEAYPTLEEIPDDASEWTVTVRGAKRLAGILAERREDALLYKRLATLRLDVPLSLGALRWEGAEAKRWGAWCASVGAERLAERPPRWKR